MPPESWETAFDPEDDNGDGSGLPFGFHITTVHEEHHRKAMTCPICGMERAQAKAEDPFCDEACEWLAANDPEVGRDITERGTSPQICAAEGCNHIVLQTAGPGRPRKFHTERCKVAEMQRAHRERQSTRH